MQPRACNNSLLLSQGWACVYCDPFFLDLSFDGHREWGISTVNFSPFSFLCQIMKWSTGVCISRPYQVKTSSSCLLLVRLLCYFSYKLFISFSRCAASGNTSAMKSEEALEEREQARQGFFEENDTVVDVEGSSKKVIFYISYYLSTSILYWYYIILCHYVYFHISESLVQMTVNTNAVYVVS